MAKYGTTARSSVSALCIIMAGCSVDRDSHTSVTGRDSAGVSIVESSSPELDAALTLGEQIVQIGSPSGDERSLLHQVSGAVLEGGRYYVVNTGSDEVRIYDAAGTYRGALGGSGDGPGELRSPTAAYVLEDGSIEVLDLDKLSVFTRIGEFVQSSPFGRGSMGRFGDGSFLTMGFAAGVAPSELGQGRDSLAVIRMFRGAFRPPDTLVVIAGASRYKVERGGGTAMLGVPFGPKPLLATNNELVFVASEASYQIDVLDTAGILVRKITRSHEPRRVTAEMKRDYEEASLEATSEENRPWLRTVLQSMSYPGTVPAIDRLLVDRGGRLWAREFVVRGNNRAVWNIFDRAGRWIRNAEMPADWEVLYIAEDVVVSLQRDCDGVEYIKAYELTTPTGAQ